MAALKQVRDILSGELSFSPEVLRSNDEAFNNALGDDGSFFSFVCSSYGFFFTQRANPADSPPAPTR